MTTKKIFVADIGGTNSRFAWFQEENNLLHLQKSFCLATQSVRSFSELFARLGQTGFPTTVSKKDSVVIAAAGPVQNEKYCRLTNIPWDIDLTALPTLSHGRVINDFVAQAFACLLCRKNGNVRIIQQGVARHDRPVAVVGAGTGLGHCALVPFGKQWLPVPSEAGSTLFSFWGQEEQEFADFFLAHNKGLPPRADQLISGHGLRLVHHFLTGTDKKPEEFIHEIDASSPTTALFARFYGRVCRQYALTVLPENGFFLSGGIASKNPFFLEHKNFLQEFHNCPKHSQFLRALPVFLVTEKEPGIWGAAAYARQFPAAQANEAFSSGTFF